jgi:hypothetical protein
MYVAFTYRNCPGDGAVCPPLRSKTEEPNKALDLMPTAAATFHLVYVASDHDSHPFIAYNSAHIFRTVVVVDF